MSTKPPSTNDSSMPKLTPERRRATILELDQRGVSIRKIARTLGLSRNTVRKELRQEISSSEEMEADFPGQWQPLIEQLPKRYHQARGNGVRIQELAKAQYGIEVKYSTLTRIIRLLGLREPASKRSGEYYFEPGAEMQHDTSPHIIEVGERQVGAQCAAAILPVSRYAFIQYYPCFTRFEIKVFLTDAIRFFGGATPRCTVDNTCVVISSGSGPGAVIAPEMEAFGGHFGMAFIAHAIGHADRKAHVERLFSYVENNFLPGRHFSDWHDLNHQAQQWCEQVANAKIKRALGTTPTAVFEEERNALLPLPRYIPPVCQLEQRVVDIYGMAHLDTNRYSVPERLVGKSVEVHKLAETVVILFQGKEIACHPRLIGVRDKRSILKGHHKHPRYNAHRKGTSSEETQLRGHSTILDRYIDILKQHLPGRGMQGMKRLLQKKQRYPKEAFMSAIKRAEQYGLFDLKRLENMILEQVRGDFFQLFEDDM